MLVSHGCHNQLPQTGWPKTKEIYCLTVLETRSGKSICQQNRALSEGPTRESVLCLCLSFASNHCGFFWFIETSFSSLPPSLHGMLPVCLSICLLLLKRRAYWMNLPLPRNWIWINLNFITCAKSCFQIRLYSQELRPQHLFWGSIIQPTKIDLLLFMAQ